MPKVDLIITNVKPSCGCTTPEYTKEAIAPGASGEIKFEFNSAGRVGVQNKSITVKSNAENINFATIGIATASDKDNLQELKGIGPFIEEKLNALGIYKFTQLAKMTSEIEEEVFTEMDTAMSDSTLEVSSDSEEVIVE